MEQPTGHQIPPGAQEEQNFPGLCQMYRIVQVLMMKKIKIAQVITRMDWGGSPDIVRLVCTSLDPERFELILITSPVKAPTMATKEFLEKFKDKVIYVEQLQREINPLTDLLALVRLYRIFRQENFDIVHTHTAKTGILGRMAARLAGVPKVIHFSHGHNFYGYFGPLGSKLVIMLERFMDRFTDKFIALTELEKNDLFLYKVTEPAKVMVINSGLELNKYRKTDIDKAKKRKELQLEENVPIVGMISRLEPVKGPQYLVEAAKAIIAKVPQVKFLILGEGSLRAKLTARCQELGMADKFIFTGWREDIPEILSLLDILVLPSLNEAVGRVLIEAGAAGIPVVATKVGGIPEIVKDGETGFLVPPQDADTLAKTIIVLLENEEKRKSLGEVAKKWIDEKFSADNMVTSVTNLYLEMVSDVKN